MQDLQVFRFQSAAVRATQKDGEVWFVLRDVCEVLEISNPSQAATRLDDDEKNTLITNDSVGRPHQNIIINESGLYSLILTSRKPEAKAFKKWVTSEVLPAIRKTGGYSLQPQQPTQPVVQPATHLDLARALLGALEEVSAETKRNTQDLAVLKESMTINSAQIAVIHRLGQRLGHLIG